MSQSKIKLLFLSKPSYQASEMRRVLEKNPKYEILFEKTAPEAMEKMAIKGIYALVLLTEKVSLRHFNLIEQVRGLGHRFPIFIFAEEESRAVAVLIEKLYGVTVFGVKQIDVEKDLLGLFSRFLTGTEKFTRISKRHSTAQRVNVKNLTTALQFSALASNMSRSGFQLEIDSGLLKLGDRLRLQVPLDKINKTHSLNGRVVWVRSSPLGKKSVGVQFVLPKKKAS